jgi:hypothetical protein
MTIFYLGSKLGFHNLTIVCAFLQIQGYRLAQMVKRCTDYLNVAGSNPALVTFIISLKYTAQSPKHLYPHTKIIDIIHLQQQRCHPESP